MGIVIGGSPRSGTSLVLSVLSGHPSVVALPFETYALCAAEPNIPERLKRLLGENWDKTWAEKTPANIQNIDVILEKVPDVKFISILRDSRGVAASCFPGQEKRYTVWPEGWVRDVNIALDHLDHPQVYTLFYENFVQNFEPELEKLRLFLGLTKSKKMVDYPQHATIQMQNSWYTSAVPVHVDALDNWKKPEHAERVKRFHEADGVNEAVERVKAVKAANV